MAALAACTPGSPPEPFSLEFVEVPLAAAAGAALPHLAVHETTAVLSWVEPASEGHQLRFASWVQGSWSTAATVSSGPGWFVNWADFPAVVPVDRQTWVAHWLVRSGDAPYAYDVALSTSLDGGTTWTAAASPHRDGTKTEHGFVTAAPSPSGPVVVWLDGRHTAGSGSHDDHAGPSTASSAAMALAATTLDTHGQPAPEALIDMAVCDCCQTDAALTDEGLIVVYRNRDPQSEERDIAAVRYTPSGWSEPVPVHQDGWVIRGCPVNGPAVDARDARVAVAWFTAAGGTPRVRVAFSEDAGRRLMTPIEVDSREPLGRVDVALLPDGSALVSWLARSSAGALLRVARVRPEGALEGPWDVAGSSGARSAGFPQMVRLDESLLIAWTEDGNPSRLVTVAASLAPQWLDGSSGR
ncbi:MAG TPA: hypothetical protein VLT59_18115 [Steroidobacteraceae bacterium]|nr:hypothetical protein [Steroidobacteraceae bacterium]